MISKDYELLKCANYLYFLLRQANPDGSKIDPTKEYTITLTGEQLLGLLMKAQHLYKLTQRLQNFIRG